MKFMTKYKFKNNLIKILKDRKLHINMNISFSVNIFTFLNI